MTAYRTCALGAALGFALMAVPVVQAATPEQTYLAARDRAIKAGSSKALGALTAQLRRIVGPMKFDGFPGPGTLNLFDEGGEADKLDGLMFSTSDGTGNLLVTTEGLLLPWLKTHPDLWKDEPKAPTDAESAFQSESFYFPSVGGDASVTIFAPVPIHTPDGAGVATAFLAEHTQDTATLPPGDLTVAVDKGGKIFVALVPLKAKLAPIAACETILKTQAKTDDEGADAYKKCWSENASSQADFAAATAQAQALADVMARH